MVEEWNDFLIHVSILTACFPFLVERKPEYRDFLS